MSTDQRTVSLELYIRILFYHMRYSTEEETVPFDITSQQGRLLEIIIKGLECGKTITRKYLEETMLIKGSSVTSLLNALVKKGFIKRSISDEDARTLNITVTPKGERTVEQIKVLFAEQEERILAGMTQEEIGQFYGFLEKACRNAGVEIK